MKPAHLYPVAFVAIIGMAACNGTGTTTTTDSTKTTMSPGDSAVTTTTTTVHHKYSGRFAPQPATKYIDLKTNKQVTVRIDTVRGSVVNDETNEPLDLFVEPTTHDTIYGATGSVVNNYIIHEPSGEMRVDTVRINTVQVQTVAVTPPSSSINEGDGKYKEKGDKSKYKDANVKVKEKNGVIKTKER